MSERERSSSRLGTSNTGAGETNPSTTVQFGPSGEEDPSGTYDPATPAINPNKATSKDVYKLLLEVSDNLASLRSQINDITQRQTLHERMLGRIEDAVDRLEERRRDRSPSEEDETVRFGRPSSSRREEKKPEPVTKPLTPAQTKGPKFKIPDAYDGKLRGKTAKQWFTRVLVYISANLDRFTNEDQQLIWALSLTTGAAADWAQPLLEQVINQDRRAPHTIQELGILFSAAFDDPDATRAAERKITTLIQTTSASDYATEFRTLASNLSWNDAAYMSQFRRGLHWQVKNTLATLETPPRNLREMISRAIEIDNTRLENEADRPARNPKNTGKTLPNTPKNSTTSTTTRVTSLKESSNFVDDQEKERRRKAGVCVKCGKAGHTFEQCRTGWKATKVEEKKKEIKKETGNVIEEIDSSGSESEKE